MAEEPDNNEILGLFDNSTQQPAEESADDQLINALLHNKKSMTLSEQGMKAVSKIFSCKRISHETIESITDRMGVHQDLQFLAPAFSTPYYSKLNMRSVDSNLAKMQDHLLQSVCMLSHNVEAATGDNKSAVLSALINIKYVVDGLSDIRREVAFRNFSPKFNKGLPSVPLDMEEKVTRMDSSERISILPKHAEALFKNVADTPQDLLSFIQRENRKRSYNNTANIEPERYVIINPNMPPNTIHQCLPFWQKIAPTDTVLLDYIVNGVDIGILGEPTQHKIGKNKFSSKEEEQFIENEIKDLLRSNSIKEHDNSKWISPLMVVTTSKMRLVLDLSSLNDYIQHFSFKCESIKDVTDLLEPKAFLTSIDLSAAYHSCAVRPHQTEYLGFKWNNKTYIYLVLPFGASSAPRLFYRITNTLTATIRANGIKMTRFYDDFLITHTDKDL
uniref:Reverse transcriptase domain-containing protein n=1 Tax=Strongyloides papillosus TaxID=174720 RepID=A0A0N5BPV0_STREA